MRSVYVLGVAARPWGKWPDKSQLQLPVGTLGDALDDAGLNWCNLEGLVAASSRFEGGMGWGLHANQVLQAVAENGAAAVNVGGGCAAGGIAVHGRFHGRLGRTGDTSMRRPSVRPTPR